MSAVFPPKHCSPLAPYVRSGLIAVQLVPELIERQSRCVPRNAVVDALGSVAIGGMNSARSPHPAIPGLHVGDASKVVPPLWVPVHLKTMPWSSITTPLVAEASAQLAPSPLVPTLKVPSGSAYCIP